MRLVIFVIGMTFALIVKFVMFSPSNERFDTNAYSAPSSSGNIPTQEELGKVNELLIKMGMLKSEDETQTQKLPQIEKQKSWDDMTDGELIQNLMNPDANKPKKTSRLPQIQPKKKSFLESQMTF